MIHIFNIMFGEIGRYGFSLFEITGGETNKSLLELSYDAFSECIAFSFLYIVMEYYPKGTEIYYPEDLQYENESPKFQKFVIYKWKS